MKPTIKDNLWFILSRLLFVSFFSIVIARFHNDKTFILFITFEPITPIVAGLLHLGIKIKFQRIATLFLGILAFSFLTLSVSFDLATFGVLSYFFNEAAIMNHSFFRERQFNVTFSFLHSVIISISLAVTLSFSLEFNFLLGCVYLSSFLVLLSHLFLKKAEISYSYLNVKKLSNMLLIFRNLYATFFRVNFVSIQSSKIELFILKFINQIVLFTWSFIRSSDAKRTCHSVRKPPFLKTVAGVGMISGIASLYTSSWSLSMLAITLLSFVYCEYHLSTKKKT